MYKIIFFRSEQGGYFFEGELGDVLSVVFLTAANHNVRNAHAVPMKRSYSVVGFRLTG